MATRLIRTVFCAAMAALLLTAPGFGASPQDRRTCDNSKNNDEVIAACTRVIDDNKESRRNRSDAYNSRGLAWDRKSDRPRALADFNEAIRLDPANVNSLINRAGLFADMGDYDRAITDADQILKKGSANNRGKGIIHRIRGEAWHGKGDHDRAIADFTASVRFLPSEGAYRLRGRSWMAKGDLGRGIADYNEAVKRDPKYDYAYYSRAVAHMDNGDGAKSLADIARANALDPKDAYYVLWLDIIERRNNTPGKVAERAAALDMAEWPAPIVRLFLGQAAPAEVLTAADAGDATDKSSRVCDANFYSAQWLLQQKKDRPESVRMLRLAATDCPVSDPEKIYARLELRALGETP